MMKGLYKGLATIGLAATLCACNDYERQEEDTARTSNLYSNGTVENILAKSLRPESTLTEIVDSAESSRPDTTQSLPYYSTLASDRLLIQRALADCYR